MRFNKSFFSRMKKKQIAYTCIARDRQVFLFFFYSFVPKKEQLGLTVTEIWSNISSIDRRKSVGTVCLVFKNLTVGRNGRQRRYICLLVHPCRNALDACHQLSSTAQTAVECRSVQGYNWSDEISLDIQILMSYENH